MKVTVLESQRQEPSQAPMTFNVEMMAEVAALLVPGQVVVGLQGIRLFRWLPFDDEEPTTVEIRARRLPERSRGPEGSTRTHVAVEIRDRGNASRPGSDKWIAAQGTVLLARGYPPAPSAGPFELTNEKPSSIPLPVLYPNLFHGPLFQGVLATERVGDEGIESRIRVLPRESQSSFNHGSGAVSIFN